MGQTGRMTGSDGDETPYSVLGALYDGLGHHNYTAWSAYLMGLLRAAGVEPGSRVVDCACGTGGITLELARAGYRMTGVDLSAAMLSEAAGKAARAGCAVPFVRQDITNLRVHRPMDAALCVCDGVNYLTDDDALQGFLASARRGLRAGGVLLFDISTDDKLRAMAGQLYGEDDDDFAYLWFNDLEDNGRVLAMDVTVFTRDEDGRFQRGQEHHRQRLWSRTEVEEALVAAGFGLMGVYEAFTTSAPGPGCPRIQFAARAI